MLYVPELLNQPTSCWVCCWSCQSWPVNCSLRQNFYQQANTVPATRPHICICTLSVGKDPSWNAKGLVTAETIEVGCNHNCNKTTMSQSIISLRLMRKVRCNKNFKCNFCVMKQRHADFWLRNSLLRFFSDNLFIFCKCCVKRNNTGLLSVKWSSVFIWNPASEC